MVEAASADAGCLTDAQQAEAVKQVTAYSVELQTDLATAGYYNGAVDGIYGPITLAAVEQLQTDSGLPVTGLVDQATALALEKKLAKASLQTAALQSILKLTGYYSGPVDGKWTPELTDALKQFQTASGLAETGAVDAATMAAFQQAIAEIASSSATTTTPETTAAGSTEAPTSAASTTTVATADSSPLPRAPLDAVRSTAGLRRSLCWRCGDPRGRECGDDHARDGRRVALADRRGDVPEALGRFRSRLERRRGAHATCALRAEQARGRGQGARVEGVRCASTATSMQLVLLGAAIVSHHRPPGAGHRARRDRAHRPQRRDGDAPGGQGGRERRRAPADADHDCERPPRR